MDEELEKFVENCRFTKRELVVLKTVKEVNEELDQRTPAIMKQVVENSDIDYKTLHDGWNRLVPKALLKRTEVDRSSQIELTEAGHTALGILQNLNEEVQEAIEQQ